jgi:Heterokaryon incompatibility protein (HET)
VGRDLHRSFRWIDTICINQYDAEERSSQVAKIGRIYSTASTTQLWVGEEDENATRAFELIRCFECISKPNIINPLMFAPTGLNAEEIRDRFLTVFPQAVGHIPPASDPGWRALFHFLDRPWFSRLWVFQEAISSSNNRIGNMTCGQMVTNVFHLYLARSLLFVDWEVETLPSGFEMVRHLMMYYSCRKIGSFPPISFTIWQVGDTCAREIRGTESMDY